MAEEESRKKAESKVEMDQEVESEAPRSTASVDAKATPSQRAGDDVQMEVDGPATTEGSKVLPPTTTPTPNANAEPEHKEDQQAPPPADEDDAVEY